MNTYLEFFCGGGMARAGLGPRWHCMLANDIDPKKAASYAQNWGAASLQVGDVGQINCRDVPGKPDLAWASFPCQDLSLAGNGAGLGGERSGTFWPFWRLIEGLAAQGRAPVVVALENVCGTLTSHAGQDFAAIGSAMANAHYQWGAVVIDAAWFLPQSRPRLFFVGVHGSTGIAPMLRSQAPVQPWHPPALVAAARALSPEAGNSWQWWQLPAPKPTGLRFVDLVEASPVGVPWHSPGQTQALLQMMAPAHLAKVQAASRAGRPMVGTIYKRTRPDPLTGLKVQRAEVRFDDIAGCLRTPGGGSSRQTLLMVDGPQIRSRLISARETARLMGLPDSYQLPERYNDAYHLTGDGVVVPVVAHLRQHLLEPLLSATRPMMKAA